MVARFGDVQARYQDLGGYELEARAQTILHGLGFADDQMQADVGTLSGGWKMRVALAQILLARPDLLLLDEPTNYLDLESILWLEGFLRDYPGTVVMTCHDREIMNRVVDKIVEIDGGELRIVHRQLRLLRGDARDRGASAARPSTRASRRGSPRRAGSSSGSRRTSPRRRRCRAGSRSSTRSRRSPSRAGSSSKHFEFRTPARSGDDVVKLDGIAQGVRRARRPRRADADGAARASAGR